LTKNIKGESVLADVAKPGVWASAVTAADDIGFTAAVLEHVPGWADRFTIFVLPSHGQASGGYKLQSFLEAVWFDMDGPFTQHLQGDVFGS
jgi:hypothetical protein